MNLHDRDIRMEAIKEVTQQKAIEDAISFYENGVSIEIIAQSLKISVEKLQEILTKRIPVHP